MCLETRSEEHPEDGTQEDVHTVGTLPKSLDNASYEFVNGPKRTVAVF